MIRINKRGLSSVIATLLIILLVIVSVSIVWVVVKNLLTKGSEDISIDKFTIDLEIVSIKQNVEKTSVNVKVKRNAGEGELDGIVFLIYDGEETHRIEVKNASLQPLEMKTYTLAYEGEIVSMSVLPLILTESGKTIEGGVADTYQANGENGGNCIPDCTNTQGEEIECGLEPNGCGTCGECADGNCYLGKCCPTGYHSTDGEICILNCDPVANCLGKQCGSNGCEGTCLPGCDLPPFGPTFICNSNQLCEECLPDCEASGFECGPVPNGCGESCGDCTILYGAGYNCESGTCALCTPDCTGGLNCGNALNGCGTCGENDGGCLGLDECISGICTPPETVINTGTVYSIWPLDVGAYFDSNDLPKVNGLISGGYWVKIPGGTCLQIDRFVIPVNPEVYNKSYIKFLTSSSTILSGDYYEIWETYAGCTGS
jgi:hypothetical protein